MLFGNVKRNVALNTLSYLIIFSTICWSQINKTNLPYVPLLGRHLEQHEIFVPEKSHKIPGRYTKTDWAQAIDQRWGNGLSTAQKLQIFDEAWRLFDEEYGAFFNLEIDLNSLRNLYRTEVEGGVSRGRFAAIMNYLSFAMKDTHTMVMDMPVNWGTQITEGTPLLVLGGFRSQARFGATLTPLSDNSLLVLKSIPNHPLGLVPGDIVLGYDGVPWDELLEELLDAQLPISPTWIWGSTDESTEHQFLMSAGLNWHLFDTIDIVKYSTGETQHLSTAPLAYLGDNTMWGNEQLPVPGVPMPDIRNGEYVTWGIIEGTNIGYVYITSYDSNLQDEIHGAIYDAIIDFMYNNQTSGFIIDYRLNYGGSIDPNHRVYRQLFNETVSTLAYDERSNPTDHYGMRASTWATENFMRIPGNPSTFYDRPIALLIGPGTVSAGDVESKRLSFHPMTRFFGKPSSGAFTISRYPELGHPDWFCYLATGTAYTVYNHQYLCHTAVPVDEEVWFTQEDVANGTDTVVERAVQWINNPTTGTEDENEIPEGFYLSDNYPNPFNPGTNIQYKIPHETHVKLMVYNSLGQVVKTLVNEIQYAGFKTVRWDGKNNSGNLVNSGIYFYSMQTDNFTETKNMLLLK